MGTVLFSVWLPALPLTWQQIVYQRGPVPTRTSSKVCVAAWSPQEALASCHPSFPGLLKSCSTSSWNSVASFPFLAWRRIRYHQAFTLIRSKQKLNQIGNSYSSSLPLEIFCFLEMERSRRDNWKPGRAWKVIHAPVACLHFQGLGRSLWWKAKSVLAFWSPLISFLLSQDII